MKLNDIAKRSQLSDTQIDLILETASTRSTLLGTSSNIPFANTGIFESISLDESRYFKRWENEALPLLLEFITYMAEADLTPDQIGQLLGNAVDHANKSGQNRTKLGKATDVGKKIAGKTVDAAKVGAKKMAQAVAVQNKIKNKIGELLQNTKTVKNIDALYEKAVAKLEEALGGPDSDISKLTKQLGAWLKAHPMYGAGIVSVLTLLATVTLGTGGLTAAPLLAAAGVSKSAIIGYFLRFTMELLKGEKLSTAAGKGLWGAMVGAIAHMGVDELQHLIGDPVIKNVYTAQAAADPGVSMSSYRTVITIDDGHGHINHANLDFLGTPKEITAIQNIIDRSQELIKAGKLKEASKLLNSLAEHTPYPEELVREFTSDQGGGKKFTEIVSRFIGKELADQSAASTAIMKVATDFESHVKTISQGLAAAANAGAVGFAGSKETTPESLNELDLKQAWSKTKDVAKHAAGQARGAASSLATKAGEKIGKVAGEYTNVITMKKLRAAWEKAGKPIDSEAMSTFLANQGFDKAAVASIFTDANIPLPQASGDPVDKVVSSLQVDLGDMAANNILNKAKNEVERLLKNGDTAGAMAFLQKTANEVAKFAAPQSPPKKTSAAASTAAPASQKPAAVKQTAGAVKKSPIRASTKPITRQKAYANKMKSKVSENIDRHMLLVQTMLKIIREDDHDKKTTVKKIRALMEYASGGSTSAGSIASIPGAGGPLMPMIRRMPAGQSFFGPAGTLPPEKPKSRKKRKKNG